MCTILVRSLFGLDRLLKGGDRMDGGDIPQLESLDEKPRRDSFTAPKRWKCSDNFSNDYRLGKTIGTGTSGKVKLATHISSGEQVVVKILPQVQSQRSTCGTSGKSLVRSTLTETRMYRAATLSFILDHPNICKLREMVVGPHHYYLVLEYVSGGQMLDYIINHGRLRERVARKFARQIGSALHYCHMNNVVHRDLKIEKILLTSTGDIKITGFGLSNFFDPASHLSTFCGSSYFVAPELLDAQLYIGPEIDVWSFGVVLYILVCGRVPFDGQDMVGLRAQIRRCLVDYPPWLSSDCKHLLSRMIVRNPMNRASLSEVMLHPWMIKGYPGPPLINILHREPLWNNILDFEVIRNMEVLEFGTETQIKREFRKTVGVRGI